MKNLKITFKGITPLLMNSCKCVNPLHPISVERKKYTSKRTKTEDDLQMISDLDWEAAAYWKDDIGMYIPAEAVEATIINGAKVNRKGTDIQKYCNVTELYIPLDYGENLTKAQLISDDRYRDVRAVNVKRAKVLRTRPRFERWSITFNMRYDESKIDLETIVNALENAGAYVGLCDYRPRYGKFAVTVNELD